MIEDFVSNANLHTDFGIFPLTLLLLYTFFLFTQRNQVFKTNNWMRPKIVGNCKENKIL